MSAHWVMLGLAAVAGWVGMVGARDVLRGGMRRQPVPIRARRPEHMGSRRSRFD